MPQINATFSKNLISDIKKISIKENKSFSVTVTKLVELGLGLYQRQQTPLLATNKKMNCHEKKHLIYSWTTLNLVIEILKKLKNEPSQYDKKNTNYIATAIKNMVSDKLKND